MKTVLKLLLFISIFTGCSCGIIGIFIYICSAWVVLIKLELIRGLRYRKLCRSQPPAWLSPFYLRMKKCGTSSNEKTLLWTTFKFLRMRLLVK